MKKLIFLLIICLSSYSLVAQNDIKKFTNIYIDGYDNLKIETVLDILNTNKDNLIRVRGESEIRLDIIKKFNKNLYLKTDDYKILEPINELNKNLCDISNCTTIKTTNSELTIINTTIALICILNKTCLMNILIDPNELKYHVVPIALNNIFNP